MELKNEFTVPAPVSEVWKTLLDVKGIAPCIPGATVDRVEDDEVAGRVKVKVGPITASYAGTARFVAKDESAHRFVLDATGRETRGSGRASATVEVQMSEQASSTHVTVGTTLEISGRQAQFGRGVMTDVASKLTEQFAACLASKVSGGGRGQRRTGRPHIGTAASGSHRGCGGTRRGTADRVVAGGGVPGPGEHGYEARGEAGRPGRRRPGAGPRPRPAPGASPPAADRHCSGAAAGIPARAGGVLIDTQARSYPGRAGPPAGPSRVPRDRPPIPSASSPVAYSLPLDPDIQAQPSRRDGVGAAETSMPPRIPARPGPAARPAGLQAAGTRARARNRRS